MLVGLPCICWKKSLEWLALVFYFLLRITVSRIFLHAYWVAFTSILSPEHLLLFKQGNASQYNVSGHYMGPKPVPIVFIACVTCLSRCIDWWWKVFTSLLNLTCYDTEPNKTWGSKGTQYLLLVHVGPGVTVVTPSIYSPKILPFQMYRSCLSHSYEADA